MEDIQNYLNESPQNCVKAAFGLIASIAIVKKLITTSHALVAGYFAGKRYKRMRNDKLTQMKEGYEKLKQLHPKEYSPEVILKVTHATISELQELLWDEHSGIDSVDLVAIFGERAYVNGMKHGWLADQMFVKAYERAQVLDEERRKAQKEGRKLSKIHGIPCSLKDHIKYKGVSSHWGRYSKLLSKADQMNLAVQCLMKDGAIPLVKSAAPTMPALTCDNTFSGEAKNPYNLERNTGGSSGGEAGLVGGNCIPFGIGSDQAGSLRGPSAFCKVTTICPSIDRFGMGGANQGLLTKENKLAGSSLVSTLGPMCKTVDDCISVMESWFSPQRLDLFSNIAKIPINQELVENYEGKKLTIAYYTDCGFVKACPGVERAVQEAKNLLEKKGHTLVELKVPQIHKYSRALRQSLFKDQARTIASSLEPYEPLTTGMKNVRKIAQLSNTKIKIIQFMLRKERENIFSFLRGQAMNQNAIQLHEWKTLFQDKLQQIGADAVLSPVLEICAPRLTDFRAGPCFVQSSIFNFTGMTGGSVPFGRVTEQDEKAEYQDYCDDSLTKGMKKAIQGSTGLPLAVQIASYPGRESLVLAVMKQIEQETQELNNYSPVI